jgi:hypothetical protein
MPASRLAKVFFAIAFIAARDIFDVPDQQTSLGAAPIGDHPPVVGLSRV